MRPRERQETSEQDLFRSRLDQIIDMKHALVKLARVHANPFAGIPPYRIGTHHTWTEQELTAYEAKWPGGAQASNASPFLPMALDRATLPGDLARLAIAAGP